MIPSAEMDALIKQYFPFIFPVFFVTLWLLVTTLLGLFSGWYLLMRKYPNREEEPLLQLKWQSGMMGLVGMSRILNIAVCPSGLRIGMMRIFGLFCRDFFVPWQDIAVVRKDRFFWQTAELHFGPPPQATLSIPVHVADRLARASLGRWPEPGPFAPESNQQAFLSVAKQWAATTFLAAAFFTVAPRVISPHGPYPPLSVAIGFPAVVFGIVSLFRYFVRTMR